MERKMKRVVADVVAIFALVVVFGVGWVCRGYIDNQSMYTAAQVTAIVQQGWLVR